MLYADLGSTPLFGRRKKEEGRPAVPSNCRPIFCAIFYILYPTLCVHISKNAQSLPTRRARPQVVGAGFAVIAGVLKVFYIFVDIINPFCTINVLVYILSSLKRMLPINPTEGYYV